jgi:transcriptional regulator with XRE-family HTH domain
MSIKDFGEKLRSARLYKGMSQRSLGLALGLSDKTISSYESGRSYPSLEILERNI